mmetsp:Transcript_27239/g.51875  ORF Transcript_27239/g.51875 Transcript_27239/m.51875 type:complete len:229 (+) Transcript_27239:704-1390(+)
MPPVSPANSGTCPSMLYAQGPSRTIAAGISPGTRTGLSLGDPESVSEEAVSTDLRSAATAGRLGGTGNPSESPPPSPPSDSLTPTSACWDLTGGHCRYIRSMKPAIARVVGKGAILLCASRGFVIGFGCRPTGPCRCPACIVAWNLGKCALARRRVARAHAAPSSPRASIRQLPPVAAHRRGRAPNPPAALGPSMHITCTRSHAARSTLYTFSGMTKSLHRLSVTTTT